MRNSHNKSLTSTGTCTSIPTSSLIQSANSCICPSASFSPRHDLVCNRISSGGRLLTNMLCNPRPPVFCIGIGKRGRRPFSITGIAMQQTTPSPSLFLFGLEGGRGAGIISPVPAGEYIKKEIKIAEGAEVHRESGTRQKPLCSSVSSVVSQPSVQSILEKNPCWHPAAPCICVYLHSSAANFSCATIHYKIE